MTITTMKGAHTALSNQSTGACAAAYGFHAQGPFTGAFSTWKGLYVSEEAYRGEVKQVAFATDQHWILMMGAAVGFIVVSVLLPIFEMNQLVR